MNIYVGNLSLEVTEEELRQEFVAFGEVLFATIVDGKYVSGGQSRGHGFVEMTSLSEGQAAITALNGKTWKDTTINVVQALPLSSRGIGNGSRGPKRAKSFSGKFSPGRY
ncbi:MAG: RNA-binding protein [Dehalococcoidia bacterium]|nr:RNA-binding protein [Dehalococcoidia bacterium]